MSPVDPAMHAKLPRTEPLQALPSATPRVPPGLALPLVFLPDLEPGNIWIHLKHLRGKHYVKTWTVLDSTVTKSLGKWTHMNSVASHHTSAHAWTHMNTYRFLLEKDLLLRFQLAFHGNTDAPQASGWRKCQCKALLELLRVTDSDSESQTRSRLDLDFTIHSLLCSHRTWIKVSTYINIISTTPRFGSVGFGTDPTSVLLISQEFQFLSNLKNCKGPEKQKF